MQDASNQRTKSGVTRFVGVREVCEALGCSRSTLARMRRDNLFPPTRQISPNRVGWPVEVIEQHLAGQARSVASLAVVDPASVSPEQLEEQAVALVVKAMEQRTGQPVDGADLGMHVIRRITEDEFHSAEKRQFDGYSERFGHFDLMRACIMAAWLFQCLRPVIQASVPHDQRAMYQDEETIALFGSAAVHDESWVEAEAYYRQTIGSGRVN